MRLIIGILIAAAAALPAGDPEGFKFWKSSELKGYQQRLAPKINEGKVAGETLATWGNHLFSVTYRAGNGEAEVHEKQADIFIPQTGEATLIYGGKIVNGRSTGPGEIRGPSIAGGLTKKLMPGDVVHIPARVPHQLMVDKQFTYAVFKVKE